MVYRKLRYCRRLVLKALEVNKKIVMESHVKYILVEELTQTAILYLIKLEMTLWLQLCLCHTLILYENYLNVLFN